jgi:hypothetical protein
MNSPDWLRPGIYGAVIGMIAATALGFAWGGWETASGSAKRASAATRLALTDAMVPVCLDRSTRDPSRAQRLALLEQASLSTRRDLLMDTGWATMPGQDMADRDIAQACLAALEIAAP